jgi:hypothetical protein
MVDENKLVIGLIESNFGGDGRLRWRWQASAAEAFRSAFSAGAWGFPPDLFATRPVIATAAHYELFLQRNPEKGQ